MKAWIEDGVGKMEMPNWIPDWLIDFALLLFGCQTIRNTPIVTIACKFCGQEIGPIPQDEADEIFARHMGEKHKQREESV